MSSSPIVVNIFISLHVYFFCVIYNVDVYICVYMHACICVYMYINVGYIYCINLLLVLSCVCFRTMMTGRIHGRRPGALCLNRRRLRSAKRLRGSAARIRRRLNPTRRCPRTDSVVLRASCPQAVNTPSPATRRPAGQGQRRGRGPRRLLTAQKSTK